MTFPLAFSLHYDGLPVQLQLSKTARSDTVIKLGRFSYFVHSTEEQHKTIQQLFQSISREPIHSKKDLVQKLKALENSPSNWERADETKLSDRKQFLARKYWDDLIIGKNKTDHTEINLFLKNSVGLDKAIAERDFNQFLSLFAPLSTDDLFPIAGIFNLDAITLGTVTSTPYLITARDLQNIKKYIDESNFTGVIHLSDAYTSYSLSSQFFFTGDLPFSIHSIGKAFTGALIISLLKNQIITPKMLDAPIQLDSNVFLKLPAKVQLHLRSKKAPTLHEIMLHQGQLGDYLRNYSQAIKLSLEQGEESPKIEKPEDFIKYADATIEENDYSNLGILLVGLSLQHYTGLPFDTLLSDHVLQPAGITHFSTTAPKEGYVTNEKHPTAKYLSGSPAGGYWTTALDLLKFGHWINKKCLEDKEFLSLLEKYGREFYHDREIHHGGRLPFPHPSSSYLSTFLDCGVTLAILSPQGTPSSAHKLYGVIKEHMLSK